MLSVMMSTHTNTITTPTSHVEPARHPYGTTANGPLMNTATLWCTNMRTPCPCPSLVPCVVLKPYTTELASKPHDSESSHDDEKAQFANMHSHARQRQLVASSHKCLDNTTPCTHAGRHTSHSTHTHTMTISSAHVHTHKPLLTTHKIGERDSTWLAT